MVPCACTLVDNKVKVISLKRQTYSTA